MTEPANNLPAVPGASHASGLATKLDYCRLLAASGMLPPQYRDRPANLLYALEFAESLGLHPMQAITGVHVIEGKPSASAALISALVRRAGHRLRVTGDDTQAVAEIVRADDPTYTFRSTWTLERARTAGLLSKGTWGKYPAAMLKARAITEVARDACEDALNGLHYTPEELGAHVDEGGNVTAEQVQQAPVEQAVPGSRAVPAVVTREEVQEAVVQAAQDGVDLVEGWRQEITGCEDLERLRDLYRDARVFDEATREELRALILERRTEVEARSKVAGLTREEAAVAARVLAAGGEVTVDTSTGEVESEVFDVTVQGDPDTLPRTDGEDWPAVAPVPADVETQAAVDVVADLEPDPTDAGVAPVGPGPKRAGAGREAFRKAKADLEAKQAAKQAEEGEA